MMAAYAEEFGRRGVKLIGLSCDDVQSHTEWIKDIEAYNVSFCYVFLFHSLSLMVKGLFLDNWITDVSFNNFSVFYWLSF